MSHRLCLCLIAGLTGLLSVTPVSAAAFIWEGSVDRNWGNTASWSGGTGVPDDNTDTVTINNDFIDAGRRNPLLADSSGNDASFTVKSIFANPNSIGNRSYTFGNVASGVGVLIMDTDVVAGNTTITANTGGTSDANNNTLTFNVGIQLNDNLILTTSPFSTSSLTLTKATFNRAMGELGGARSVTKSGSQRAVFNAANSYSGGTIVTAGELVVGVAGTLGSGDVTVNGGLLIINNTANIINDLADVTIAGGAQISLVSGINDIVGTLTLGGLEQSQAGTYGSASSGADHQSGFFAGTGVLTIIPEPAAAALLLAGIAMMLPRRRR
ncbi:MAG: autotransporter-associated beta strand repeat-containing protein [Phycisphaeraceae bacterium]